MSTLQTNLNNRKWLLGRLKAEIVGPDPSGHSVDEERLARPWSWKELRAPKKQLNGEEILWQDPPIKRYGAGILFPAGVSERGQLSEEADATPEDLTEDELGDIEVDGQDAGFGSDEIPRRKTEIDASDDPVALANAFRPSALGVSFLADLEAESKGLTVSISWAHYEPRAIEIRDEEGGMWERTLWLRRPHEVALEADIGSLAIGRPLSLPVPAAEGKLELMVILRRQREDTPSSRLITVALINRVNKHEGRLDERCFFQCEVGIRGLSGNQWILPYPEILLRDLPDEDESKIGQLLFRTNQTFAIGHGCAADWPGDARGRIAEVMTDVLPTFELPSLTPDIKDQDGRPIRVSMRKLAGLDTEDDGIGELQHLLKSYRQWVDGCQDFETHEPEVPKHLTGTAGVLLDRCRACLTRIESGLAFLQEETETARKAQRAFKLANHAMLLAQLRGSRNVRVPEIRKGGGFDWPPQAHHSPDQPHPSKGYWRAFQIAFLLMTLRGVADDKHPERDVVDLIWFPTGGGKTEAYLALTAFAVFFRRLDGVVTRGADVLMRYTLRLLTAQQFQRAATLFCAMEHLRRLPENNDALGTDTFSLGMWVGEGATPNSRAQARSALRKLQKDPQAVNPFILLKCPWCNAKFGPHLEGKTSNILGYARVPVGKSETVVFRCDDPACEYSFNPARPGSPFLPVQIIDEDLLASPPSLVIATVDKLAMLTWKPETRALFGRSPEGEVIGAVPTLVIQDELHLISGPLGSMVGLYETAVEMLCRVDADSPRPKIVASTATISRADEQVKALYARAEAVLFPPSGLESNDSFFAQDNVLPDGGRAPGRLYAGVMGPGHGSAQTTLARIFAVLLQYPAVMEAASDEERDPWWTLMAFFNSLRELGIATTLLVSDTRDYLRVIIDRHGYPYKQIRQLINWLELTSRIRGDEIPLSLQRLETPHLKGSKEQAVEACLASSLIEVGLDIDRLALMTIAGQPKTTSQYIQVSSRVGRAHDRPGLVVVQHNPGKPRDRSHYERFRSFHERLYAQVEPTSVTPFSPPAVDRALHAVLVALVRQLGSQDHAGSPRPLPFDSVPSLETAIRSAIETRARFVDPEELPNVLALLDRRIKQWRAWCPMEYGGFGPLPEDPPLMHPAGSHSRVDWQGHSWPTLTSMRNVDASCEAEVTRHYNEIDGSTDT